jgi:thiol-disulfide isomerase/thioredoxin
LDARRGKLLVLNAALVTAAVVGFVLIDHVAGVGKPAASAAAVRMPRLDADLPAGEAPDLALADLRGHPVVLNFWASWCGYCSDERPELQRLGTRLHGAIVAVATMDRRDAAAASEAADPHGFPVVLDSDGGLGRAFGVDSLPQTFILDASGAVVRHYSGALSATDVASISSAMTRLASAPPVPAAARSSAQ